MEKSMAEAYRTERLKRESRELDNYIHKLNKKGNNSKAYKIAKRQSLLNVVIDQLQKETL